MGTFSDVTKAKRPPQSLEDQILRRVRRLGRGAVVTPGHFAKLGGRAAIDKALSRLVAAGRLGRKNVDDDIVGKMHATLDEKARRQVAADLEYAPAWIADVMRRVVQDVER